MQTTSTHHRLAVLLLAFGGPASLSEIEPFLKNILCGRAVSPHLVEQVRERYRAIGGASPLREITERQAGSLKRRLLSYGKDVAVAVGMRYWHPAIPDALTALIKEGVEQVLYLIMSPYTSPAAIGGYEKAVRCWQESSAETMHLVPVTGWHSHPHYLKGVTEKLREGLAAFPSHRRAQVHIIFTAHSLPLPAVKHDPYVEQTRAVIAKATQAVGSAHYHLAFQSRGKGAEEWLQPDPEQLLRELAHGGVRDVLVAPVGFVADHLETLYDLDVVLKKRAAELGLELHRCASLNDDPHLIDALAETVLLHLPRPVL